MKIWVTEIGEPLPIEDNTRLWRYGQFCEYLSGCGAKVTWWASSFSHTAKRHIVEEDQILSVNGYQLRLIHGPGYKNNVSIHRVFHIKHFSERFYQQAQRVEKPDLILSPIPTIDVAAKAIRYGLKYQVPVITDIRDLWPDEIKDLAPKILRPFFQAILFNSYRKLSFVCKNSFSITGVSQSYVNYGIRFSQRQRDERDFLFPFGYTEKKMDRLRIEQAKQEFLARGIDPEKFTLVFLGTIGKFFDLKTVIQAYKLLDDKKLIQILICGDGSSKKIYEQMAEGEKNIHFLGWLNQSQIYAAMELSQVGLAPYKIGVKMELPNKPFEYMAGSLALLSSLEGELSMIIRKYQIGLNYQANNAVDLARKISCLRSNLTLTRDMGIRAHDLMEREYVSEKIFERVYHHLQKYIKNGSEPYSLC